MNEQTLLERFLEAHPEYQHERIDVTEDGDIFVHKGGVYPLHFIAVRKGDA